MLDILPDVHFMSFFTALGFLLLKLWKESKYTLFTLLVLMPGERWIDVLIWGFYKKTQNGC